MKQYKNSSKYRLLAHHIDDLNQKLLSGELTVMEVKSIVNGIHADFKKYDKLTFQQEESEHVKFYLDQLLKRDDS